MNPESELISRYNYDEFTREKVLPLLNFENSPPLGQKTANHPLWELNGNETNLYAILSGHLYTVVEFGSFT